jgi:DNA polymerase I
MDIGGRHFQEVWLVDFEFQAPPGERPKPICLVALELNSGRLLRIWEDELLKMRMPPYAMDRDALFVAYYSSAEFGCHLALGWQLPVNVLDLYVEFRNLTNGLPTPAGASLLGALSYFGLNGIDATEKKSMRDLAIRGGPWTWEERQGLLEYCQSDVVALEKLLLCMTPHLDIDRALLRGRYMKASAHMEDIGVPIDTKRLQILQNRWEDIQEGLIQRIDEDFGVFDGQSFIIKYFIEYLNDLKLSWPVLPSGMPDLSADVFKEMSITYPQIQPLKELRASLSKMRLSSLAVGSDGRNRIILSAFQARTSRNQPSNSNFIFGPAVWLRGLIKPGPGYGLAYVDYSQQEFGIAAALSGDHRMQEAYQTGDPYLAFAKQAGAVPMDATKQTHGGERELFKACALGTQYGMGPDSLAVKIQQCPATARELLQRHRETYKRFWAWSDGVVDYASLHNRLWTVFGWQILLGVDPNSRSLRNFPMQSNGAEMLRLACCFMIERGLRVCAPVHDAVLIEAPLEQLDEAVGSAQEAMADASALVLSDFRLRTDAVRVRYPDRYEDARGAQMWRTVWGLIENGAAPTLSPTSRAGRRRAEKEQALQTKHMKYRESQWRRDASQIARENSLQVLLADVTRLGGFRYDSVAKDYDSHTIRELNTRRPGLVSKRGDQELDVIATDYGFASGDELVQAILASPSLGESTESMVEVFRREYEETEEVPF